MNDTDLRVLKNIISDRKVALDFVSNHDVRIFSSEYWHFANLTVSYIKKYQDVPTLRSLQELSENVGKPILKEKIEEIWNEVHNTKASQKEFKFDIDKLKLRVAEAELFKIKNELSILKPGSVDVQGVLNRFNNVSQSIQDLYNETTYESKGVKDYISTFVEKFNFRKNNPEEAMGLLTGYSFLDFATNGLRPADMLLVAGESGFGKCHAKGQEILKYDGTLIKVEDIVVGDLLMGPDSNPRKVLSLNTGKDYMYDIVPNKGKSFRVNSHHILTCSLTDSDKLIDISVLDYLKLPDNSSAISKNKLKLRRASIEFNDHKELYLDPYFLGLLIGDGSMSHTSITITSMDEEIISYSNKIAESFNLSLKNIGNVGRGKAYSYLFSGTKGKKNIIASYLEHYKLRFTKSGNKFIPFEYKTSTRQNRLAILAGIIDIDGHFNKKGTFEITTKSKQLSSDIVFISRSLGFAAYEKEVIKTCNNFSGIYHRVTISGHLDDIPTKLKRKQAFTRNQIKDVLNVGFKVMPTNNVEQYYGFSVDKDHRYILDDFTITHNSLFLQNIAVQVWQQQNTVVHNEFVSGKNLIYFSLEMPYEDCFNRFLSKLSGVPSRKIESAKLTKDEFSRVKDVLHFIHRYPNSFRIVDITDASSNDLESVMLKAGEKFDAVFVDYLGIMNVNAKSDEADWMKQSQISYELRHIARKYKLPLFSAVQLNRKSQKEGSDNIGLSRLARSSGIATHATHVIQIESRQKEEQYPDFLYHIIKNRKGPKGKGVLNKNLSCATLIDKPIDDESDDHGFTDLAGDISLDLSATEDLDLEFLNG